MIELIFKAREIQTSARHSITKFMLRGFQKLPPLTLSDGHCHGNDIEINRTTWDNFKLMYVPLYQRQLPL